tara:strand:+ start:163 stop:504 length:342 start_codon:yes stop_codon:yes gene_type:complete
VVRAGQLRQRVNIEQSTQAADAAGQLTDSWQSVRECSARVLDVSASETFLGSQIEATTSSLVIIRYPQQGTFPTSEMRVVYEDGDTSRTLNIEKVQRRDERQQQLWLHCTEDS